MSDNERPASAPAISSKSERLYYIDWLRLMAVFLLFFYHTARIFDPREDFYVHNAQLSPVLFDTFIWSLGPWHMSLFFLLAGASTYYSLQRRGSNQYVKERFKRLFIPFVFGVLILIPPQSYLGLISHSGYSESYLRWFPNFFVLQGDDIDGYFMGGHTWGQLWFIIHLFIYSLVALRLFLYFNGESGRRLTSRLAGAFVRPGVIFLFPVLLVLADEFPEIAGGNPLFYITFFICGYLFMSDPRFMGTIDRRRVILLILGPVVFAAYLVLQGTNAWPADIPGWADRIVEAYVVGFVPWFVILTLLAYGRRRLGFSNRFLKYFAEGAYPLYILHQTIIVAIGYFVVQWDVAVAVKYTAVVLLSFASTVVAYDVLVRRTNVTRFLLGMRPRGRAVLRLRPSPVVSFEDSSQ